MRRKEAGKGLGNAELFINEVKYNPQKGDFTPWRSSLIAGYMTGLSDDVGAPLLEKGAPPALRAPQSRPRRVVHIFTLQPPSQNFCTFLRIPQAAPARLRRDSGHRSRPSHR